MRTIHTADAIEWLKNEPVIEGRSYVASLPDISEFQSWTLEEWKEWFTSTSELVLSRTPDNGVTIFYQTDIKYEGQWIDKAFLVQKAAERLGHAQLWHKVICRVPAGTATFGRPAYSHVLCFSKSARVFDFSRSTPDVISDLGEKTWERGMGMNACTMIAKFIKNHTESHTLVHPFCGEGSMISVAESIGLDTIGIERSPKRADKARRIELTPDHKSWILI